MTYKTLLADLQNAERFTGDLEAYVAMRVKNEKHWINDGIETLDAVQIEAATWFINDMVVKSRNDTDQDGTDNAYDTVADYSVDFDSLVGQFIFADTNCPANV